MYKHVSLPARMVQPLSTAWQIAPQRMPNLGKKPTQALAMGWGLQGAWGKSWGAWSLVWVMPSTCYIVWVDLSPGPQGLFSPGGWTTVQERQS